MNHIRHSGLFNAKGWSVTLIGAGGIGALTAVTLAKMGIERLTVFDDDDVDEVNLPTQFYRILDLSTPKVFALDNIITAFSDETRVSPIPCRVDPKIDPAVLKAPIIISAVDSITARQQIWQAVKQLPWLYYLDARMSAETFQLYTVTPQTAPGYESALFALQEGDVEELPCTSKATIYTGCIAAGQIGAAVRKILTGIEPRFLLVHDILEGCITQVG